MTFSWQLVLFEILNFCLLMMILGRFLYRPVRETLRKRRDEIEQARRDVEASKAEATRVRTEFEARRTELEQEAESLRSFGRRRGEEDAERLIQEAREETHLERERFQEDLLRTEQRALDELRRHVLGLAVDAAARAVSGMELPDIATAYARLGSRRLREQISATDGEPLRVAVSPDAELDGVRAALEESLGPDCNLELTTDPELVGGVRLRFRDLEIDASAGTTLRSWLEEAQRTELGGAKGREG